MKNYLKTKEKSKYSDYIFGAVTGIVFFAIAVFAFALITYVTGKGFDYSALFGTLSIAVGTFAAAYYIALKKKCRGLIIGAVTGLSVFIVITLISLFLNKGAVTLNTVFHFVIWMLSAIIGAVLGVSKKSNKKYI